MGDRSLHIIAFGAHPDDCDLRAGGTAAKWAALGHLVRFVSLTNGDAGHHEQGGPALARRRRAEATEAGRRIGVDYLVLDHGDGALLADLELRGEVIREIRRWQADLVLAHRPNDYHPDHRYTGIAVQDAAYLVTVPNIAPEVPALARNPVFLHVEDGFLDPRPFRADIAVVIDDVIDRKVAMLDAHVSQFYEWLPWHAGKLDDVPADPGARKAWLERQRTRTLPRSVRDALELRYGPAIARGARHAEAFEICEYGTRPDEPAIRALFPFFSASD